MVLRAWCSSAPPPWMDSNLIETQRIFNTRCSLLSRCVQPSTSPIATTICSGRIVRSWSSHSTIETPLFSPPPANLNTIPQDLAIYLSINLTLLPNLHTILPSPRRAKKSHDIYLPFPLPPSIHLQYTYICTHHVPDPASTPTYIVASRYISHDGDTDINSPLGHQCRRPGRSMYVRTCKQPRHRRLVGACSGHR